MCGGASYSFSIITKTEPDHECFLEKKFRYNYFLGHKTTAFKINSSILNGTAQGFYLKNLPTSLQNL